MAQWHRQPTDGGGRQDAGRRRGRVDACVPFVVPLKSQPTNFGVEDEDIRPKSSPLGLYRCQWRGPRRRFHRCERDSRGADGAAVEEGRSVEGCAAETQQRAEERAGVVRWWWVEEQQAGSVIGKGAGKEAG